MSNIYHDQSDAEIALNKIRELLAFFEKVTEFETLRERTLEGL